MAHNAPPQAQLDAQNALLHHDRVRRSTDLPTYHGIAGKDTINARDLIKRFEAAAEIAKWEAADKKCNEFFMILRDDALTWWASMKDYNVDTKNWNDVKAHFLKKFDPKSTAKTSCANLMELSQRPGESATKFHFRLFKIYERLCEARPATIYDVVTVPAVAAAATVAEQQAIKKEGIEAMEMFIKHQLFIAGLREPLRSEVMKEGKATLGEAIDFADELESIYRKNEKTINALAECNDNVDAIDGGDAINIDDLADDELEAINMIRQRNGKKPFMKRRNGNNGNNSNFRGKSNNSNGNGNIKCRYCKKPNHMQRECKSRLRDKAPMVDANGKPFTKKINAVSEKAEDFEDSEVSALNYI